MMRANQLSAVCPRDPRRSAGLSLVELMISLTIMSLLMAAMGSTVLLATKALPDPTSQTFTILQSGQVADDIAEELRYAVKFTQRLPNLVEFTVADRDNDQNPETILYQWSGTPGDPLIRQYNSGTVVNVLDSVQQFNLTYDIRSVVDTAAQQPVIEGAEQVFIQQDNGNIGDAGGHIIKAGLSSAQYFMPTLPTDAVSWKITRVQCFGVNEGGMSSTLQVSVRSRAPGGEPSGTVVDEVLIPEAEITATEAWNEIVFANASGLDPAVGYFIAFMQYSGSATTLVLQLGGSGPAYPNTTYYHNDWSEDTTKDIWLWVWGTVSAPDSSWVPPTIDHLQTVMIGLQAGDLATAIEIETEVLNLPVVP